MSIFSTSILRSAEIELEARIELDPSQPYLLDHQPGGHPLFGTVMNLEAMQDVAGRLAPGVQVSRIEACENLLPFILHPGKAPCLYAKASVVAADRDAIHVDCTLLSISSDRNWLPHCRSRFIFGGPRAPRPMSSSARLVPTRTQRAVMANEIYQVFFHGPSLRLVRGAYVCGPVLYGQLETNLPPLFTPRTRRAASAPRLVEFALQCAGLIDVALSGRMMIPRAIARLERFSNHDVDSGVDLWAVVERGACVGSDSPCLNIDVVDRSKQTHLRVSGYVTAPLPFESDLNAVAQLCELFDNNR